MDQTRLDAIRARCEAATPGPWNAIDKGNTVPSYAIRHFAVGEKCVNVASGISPKTGDADFIAHARQDVPDLLAEVERLTAELADARTAVQGAYMIAEQAKGHMRENAKLRADLAAMTAERDAAKKEIDEWRDLTISTTHKWVSKILEAADYSKRVRRARRQRDEWRERAQVPDDVKAAMDKMGDARCVDGGCPLYLAAREFWMAWDEWRGPEEDKHGTA